MRVRLNALLTLPTLLSAFVAAVPSPAAYLQQSLQPAVQQQPRWRSLSNRLIETIWGLSNDKDSATPRQSGATGQQLPRHTLARYGNDVVLRFNVSTSEEAASLAEAADTLLLDVWHFTHHWVDIRLAKDIVPSLLGLLPSSLQHSHTPLLHDRELALAVYDTYPNPHKPQITTTPSSHSRDRQILHTPALYPPGTDSSASGIIFFEEYRPLNVIEPWMRFLSRIFSTHVRLISIGQSYDGREILGLRVGVHPSSSDPEPRKRKTVLITGGMHAREWISTSTVNYIAFNLITSYAKDEDVTKLLETFDFVFIPTVNPDGYVYTWETDRLWRKNRQQTTVRFCQGIDLDHGFGFEWDSVSTAGNPCSESYSGEAPFDAVESKALADWARSETENNNVEFVGFLDLHSYSQQILYPYSYSCDDTPPSQENLEELALGLEKAIRRSSSFSYEPMAACEGNNVVVTKTRKQDILPRIEQAGGSALDWFYHEMHVKYAYQIKLRDRGSYGFLLPKENIVPTGKEILEAVLYLAEFLREGYPKSIDVEEEDVREAYRSPVEFVADNDNDWVYVEDLGEDEPQWDLRRRRKR